MRDQYNLTLRIVSIMVVSFFCWLSGGITGIAYALNGSGYQVAGIELLPSFLC
jgi:hypothetical protein